MIKKFFILVSFVAMAATGFSQVSTVRFLLQPDGTFKTEDGHNYVAIDSKGLTTADFGPRFRMAARLSTNGECVYEDGYGMTVQNNVVYPGASTDWGYSVNYAFQIDAYKKNVRVMAPVITYFIANDKARYHWWAGFCKSNFFKNDGSRRQDSFDLEVLINKQLNDILTTVFQDFNK